MTANTETHPEEPRAREYETIYILHSQFCKDSGIDLRDCPYSRALDQGVRERDWSGWENRPVVLITVTGWLTPTQYQGDT